MIRICIAFICTLAISPLFAQRNIDIIHYRYDITLNDQHDTIYGVAEISMRFLAPVNIIELDLTAKGNDGRGMTITKVTGPYTRGFAKEPEKFKIVLLKQAKAGDSATYTITYHGKPKDGLIISKNKYGHRTFFADNWPNRGHHWIPCVDDPADKASVEFIVTAPHHYQVVANGIQQEETNLDNKMKRTHWKEDVPISTKVMVIGVSAFAVQLSGTVNGSIPVYSWVYPDDRDKGFFDYAQAVEILPYFINQVGPYPYKKLANVQSKTTFGGLENANTIFYSESSITGTRKSETLLAHEIAHQWFGNMATEKTFAHLWLSEGFATYMTILYMENKYGVDTAISMLKQDREEVIAYSRENSQPVVDNNPDYMALLNVNSYQKGGWVLHMLRRQLVLQFVWRENRGY
jgi:aminopeptidase N